MLPGRVLVSPKLIGLGGESKAVELEVLIQAQGNGGAAQAPSSGYIGVQVATIFRTVGSKEVTGGGALGRQDQLRRNSQGEGIVGTCRSAFP